MTSEISWFSALCDDDYEFLGLPDADLQSSWEHCRNIVLTADRYGFDNVLLPSGYALGIDNTAFAAGMAPHVADSNAARDPLRRTRRSAGGEADGNPGPDVGWPPHDQHHLQRPPW